ncbi:MAG: GNAT family N-acetyltransferase [Gammaproteobacteria bacterium]
MSNIRTATTQDGGAVAAIYNHFVTSTVVTFEEDPLSVDAMADRISTITANFPWIVAEEDDAIIGYAYASRFDVRAAYGRSVETTVYVEPGHSGRGIGSKLYRALLDDLMVRETHCAIAKIALPNDSSVALHEKFGFAKVGELRDIGYKLDRWVDVGYWELLF